MQFDAETLHEAQTQHLYDRQSHMLAPIVLWGGLVLLRDDEPMVGSWAQAKVEDNTTTWRVLWITPTRAIFAEATKAKAEWDAYDEDKGEGTADSLTTWCRPLSDVERLELVDQTVFKERYYSDQRTWRSGARLIFRDGPEIDLPLFDKGPTHDSRDAFETLLSDLVKQLWR